MTKKTQAAIISENSEYIIRRVKAGVNAGASKKEIISVVGKEFNIPYNSMSRYWYKNLQNGELKSPPKSKEVATTKKKVGARKILEEVISFRKDYTNNAKDSELARHEAQIEILKKLKMIEDSQSVLSSVILKTQTDNKKLESTTQAQYLIGKDNSVKYLGEPTERVFTSDEVDKLIKKIDKLEAQSVSQAVVLEDRREENNRLRLNIVALEEKVDKKDKLLQERNLETLSILEEKKALDKEMSNKELKHKSTISNHESAISNLQKQLKQTAKERDELASRGVIGRLFNKNMNSVTN